MCLCMHVCVCVCVCVCVRARARVRACVCGRCASRPERHERAASAIAPQTPASAVSSACTSTQKRRYMRRCSRHALSINPAAAVTRPDRGSLRRLLARFESWLARALAERRVARVPVSAQNSFPGKILSPLDRWLSVFACPLSEPPPAPVPVRRPPTRSMPCGKASSRRPPSPRPPQSLRIRSGALSQNSDRTSPYTAKE